MTGRRVWKGLEYPLPLPISTESKGQQMKLLMVRIKSKEIIHHPQISLLKSSEPGQALGKEICCELLHRWHQAQEIILSEEGWNTKGMTVLSLFLSHLFEDRTVLWMYLNVLQIKPVFFMFLNRRSHYSVSLQRSHLLQNSTSISSETLFIFQLFPCLMQSR